MSSNLHLKDHLLPIAAMNVISILPLLLLAPLMECVMTCYLSMEKTPPAPVKRISEYLHACKPQLVRMLSLFILLNIPLSPLIPSFCLVITTSRSSVPSLITPPCPSSPSSSGPCMCHSVGPGCRFDWAAEEVLPPGGADTFWKAFASFFHAVFPAGSSVHPARSGRSSRHPCVWVGDLLLCLRLCISFWFVKRV